jgi:UDP-glucose 6-dehydrogenase
MTEDEVMFICVGTHSKQSGSMSLEHLAKAAKQGDTVKD